MSTMTETTLRFLQEENQRLREHNDELRDAISLLRGGFKSLRALQHVLAYLDTREDVQPLLDRIMYEALRVVDATDGSLILIDEDAQELVFVRVFGGLETVLEGYRMPVDTGIAGWVIANHTPAIANDVANDERFSSNIDESFSFSTQSLACVPLISRGKVLGVIEVVNKFSGQPFNEQDIDLLMILALLAAFSFDLAGMEQSPAVLSNGNNKAEA